MEFRSWRHVFKLDPNKRLDDSVLTALVESGTDAFLIGGTDGVNAENTFALYERMRGYDIPLALEMSHPEQVVRGFDHYFIPTVLNAGIVDWIIGHQAKAFEKYGHLANDHVTGQGYIVLNPDAKVAHVTEAKTTLSIEEAVAYAETGHHLFRLPSLYLEYSGVFGSPELVKEVRMALPDAHLFYGGGITGYESARMMSAYADTIVVGNVIYDNLEGALATVAALR